MDIGDDLRRQFDRQLSVGRIDAVVAVAEAKDSRHAVLVMQGEHERPNHVVQTGTEAAAGDYTSGRSKGIEVEVPAGACGLEQRGVATAGAIFEVQGNEPVVGDERC